MTNPKMFYTVICVLIGVLCALIGVMSITRLILAFYWDDLKKKSSEHQFPSEKKSRARVANILKNSSISDKEKVLSLNSELGIAMNSIFISEEWEHELLDISTKIKEKNNFTFEDLFAC